MSRNSMMKRGGSLLLGGLLATAFAATASNEALAVTRSTTLYPVQVGFHFADAQGHDHVLVVTAEVVEPGGCIGPYVSAMGANSIAGQHHRPDLAKMTFTGATCQGSNGVVRAVPLPQAKVMFPGFNPAKSYKPLPQSGDQYAAWSQDVPDPAAVALTYRLITGKIATYTFAPRLGEQAIDLSTCPANLHSLAPRYMGQVLHYGYFPGGTFLAAKCVPLRSSQNEAKN